MPPPSLDRFEWERLVRALPMPMPVKCTAFALATFANGDGNNAHPGTETLAIAAGASRRTILRALAELERQGLIYALAKGGGKGVRKGDATVWQLSLPRISKPL